MSPSSGCTELVYHELNSLTTINNYFALTQCVNWLVSICVNQRQPMISQSRIQWLRSPLSPEINVGLFSNSRMLRVYVTLYSTIIFSSFRTTTSGPSDLSASSLGLINCNHESSLMLYKNLVVAKSFIACPFLAGQSMLHFVSFPNRSLATQLNASDVYFFGENPTWTLLTAQIVAYTARALEKMTKGFRRAAVRGTS